MRSVPGAVATGSYNSAINPSRNPVATAPGTDSIVGDGMLSAAFLGVVNFKSTGYDYERQDMAGPESMCPRCGIARLRRFDELSEEEREVVKRLPASADYSFDEREARHRWCTRCWYEDTGDEPQEI